MTDGCIGPMKGDRRASGTWGAPALDYRYCIGNWKSTESGCTSSVDSLINRAAPDIVKDEGFQTGSAVKWLRMTSSSSLANVG